ncbi:MAG: sugar kinase [Planctomycetes bacterium]|nr:sugar kinase [Planctomycetota bacterium]MCB9903981.1 sugar kinase [Planctomycetota bacterium]
MSLIVIGTIAYDSIETVHDRREEVLGGSATYFALAASRYTEPRLVGVVGEDFKPEHRALFADQGVHAGGLEVAAGKTFRWGGRYEPDWNTRHTTFTELNVLADFDPKVCAEHRDSKYVFLANAVPAIQAKALDQLEHPSFVVLDTMNLWIDGAREDLVALMRRIDAIVLNDEEARMLTGESNLIRAASAVLGMGPRYVILKKGEHGAFLMSSDVHFSLPAYPVSEVVDPTGAGDSFAGGFMGYVASQDDTSPATLRKAMLHGTVTASFCVQGFSVESMTEVTREELDRRYDELLGIVTV